MRPVSNVSGMTNTHRRLWIATGVVAALCLSTVAARQATSATPDVAGLAVALDLYARGEHAQAVEKNPLDGMDIVSVIGALEAWIGPLDPKKATAQQRAVHERRGQVAARFVIDVAAFRGRTWMTVGMPMFDGLPTPRAFRIEPRPDVPMEPSPPPFDYDSFNAPMVAWACARVPKTGPVEPWEAGWWMASIAMLQKAGEWGVLQGNQRISYSGSEPQPWRLAVRQEVEKGHLVEARQRLGAHPRLRLAEAVTKAAALTDATARFVSGAAGPRLPGRYDVLRLLEDFARTTNSGRFADVERSFEELLSEPEFESEISLRIAQLRLMRRDWPTALRWLDRASAATSDNIWLATVDYFRGWIHERTNRPADALSSYRAAHQRYDLSPNLNTLLATQLMLSGQRTEAARVLERTMRERHDHTWRDLWLLLLEGDARRASQYVLDMREAR